MIAGSMWAAVAHQEALTVSGIPTLWFSFGVSFSCWYLGSVDGCQLMLHVTLLVLISPWKQHGSWFMLDPVTPYPIHTLFEERMVQPSASCTDQISTSKRFLVSVPRIHRCVCFRNVSRSFTGCRDHNSGVCTSPAVIQHDNGSTWPFNVAGLPVGLQRHCTCFSSVDGVMTKTSTASRVCTI